MTAIYSIPQTISTRHAFRSKPVSARAIKAIIPTYKDWDGLRVTVESLLNLKTPPKKIVVANDNPEGTPAWLANYPVELVDYPGNVGPAQARNRGFGLRVGLPDQLAAAPLSETVGAPSFVFPKSSPFPTSSRGIRTSTGITSRTAVARTILICFLSLK